MSAPLGALALLLALAAPATPASAPATPVPTPAPAPPRFEVTLDETSITVGDPVTVTARLRLPVADARVPAEIVGVDSKWGEAEVLAPARLEPGRGADGERVWTLRVTAFRPGRIELPPLEVRLESDPPRTLRAPSPLALEIVSVLPPGAAGELSAEPPAPPRPLPFPARLGWTLGALAAALAATAFALARGGRRATAATPAPPPIEELERALAALASAEPAAGHALLSTSLRRYLGRRLGFPALESTTTEVARRLAGTELDPELPRRTRRLLGDCDAVKFALRRSSGAELSTRHDEALALAREVETALASPAPEAARA